MFHSLLKRDAGVVDVDRHATDYVCQVDHYGDYGVFGMFVAVWLAAVVVFVHSQRVGAAEGEG